MVVQHTFDQDETKITIENCRPAQNTNIQHQSSKIETHCWLILGGLRWTNDECAKRICY